MAPSSYYSKYTLRNYISEKGKKEASPPPPTPFDYLRAEMKESKLTETSPLSAEALPFSCKKSSVSVASLMSPNRVFQIAVHSSFLALSTLRQFFPLATGLHYITDQQMITLAISNNFTMSQDGVELSHQKFCIPFLGTEVTYMVTEDGDLMRNEESDSVMDNIVNYATDIHDKMSANVAEVQKMKDLAVQFQNQLRGKEESHKIASLDTLDSKISTLGEREEAHVGDGLENLVSHGQDSHMHMEECLAHNDDPHIFSAVADHSVIEGEKASNEKSNEDVNETNENLLYNKIKIYVDDYGFSDTEEEDSDNMFTRIEEPVLAKNEDILSDLNIKPALPPFLKQLDTSRVSSRPRCVQRILGN